MDRFVGPLIMSVFYVISLAVSYFVPADAKPMIGFLFGASAVALLVIYYTRIE